jgi:predicted secreted protein
MRFSSVLIIFLALQTVQPARAHEPAVHYDHVSLSARAGTEVPQDQLQVSVYALAESENAQDSASTVSNRIHDALALINQHKEMTAQTGSFTTQPVYHKQTINRWRSRQNIQIKTNEVASLSQLLGALQQYVQLENISYQVSDLKRQQIENELIKTAVRNFQQRAQLVTESLGRETYRIVDMNVSTQNHIPRPMATRAMSSMAEAAVAPAIQAGKQKVEVTVNGTVELQLK